MAFKASIHFTASCRVQQSNLTSMFYLTGCSDKCVGAGGDYLREYLL